MRRSLLTGLTVVVVMMLLILGSSVSWAQEKGPIKIGYIVPVTGAFAENGKDMQNGAIHYLEEVGYQVA